MPDVLLKHFFGLPASGIQIMSDNLPTITFWTFFPRSLQTSILSVLWIHRKLDFLLKSGFVDSETRPSFAWIVSFCLNSIFHFMVPTWGYYCSPHWLISVRIPQQRRMQLQLPLRLCQGCAFRKLTEESYTCFFHVCQP